MKLHEPRIVIIDGPSGSGKSTVANIIANQLNGRAIQGDDYLLTAIREMPDEMKEIFGRYPDYEKNGFGCLFFDDQERTVKLERDLFEITRDTVESQLECEIEKSDQDVFVIDYITSNKFKHLWLNSNFRIMMQSDPKIRQFLLAERIVREKLTTQTDIPQIREKAFAPLLKNAHKVNSYIYNNYDNSLRHDVGNTCMAIADVIRL